MNLTKNITFNEAIHSSTAKRFGIENKPNNDQIMNMIALGQMIFEALRDWVGGPIKINSMFRSEELNKVLGGSKTSQHMKGEAMDLDDTYGYKTNNEMFNWIKDNLDYDQLIGESPDKDGNFAWIHVSYNLEHNRKETFIL